MATKRRRQREGDETWRSLQDWTKGVKASERLAGHILRSDGYQSIDPSHPLGGKDRLKDILCKKQGIRWIGAAHFPRKAVTLTQFKKKFMADLKGVEINKGKGMAFVTNQELKLHERKKLAEAAKPHQVDIYHLERISSLLDSPALYGIRLDFLDIEMSKEEQVAFFSQGTELFQNLQAISSKILPLLESHQLQNLLPRKELRNFKKELELIVGPILHPGGISAAAATYSIFPSAIQQLRVPLWELQEFKKVLESVIGSNITSPGTASAGMPFGFSAIQQLHVPLEAIRDYEVTLDRILKKQAKLSPPGRDNKINL